MNAFIFMQCSSGKLKRRLFDEASSMADFASVHNLSFNLQTCHRVIESNVAVREVKLVIPVSYLCRLPSYLTRC